MLVALQLEECLVTGDENVYVSCKRGTDNGFITGLGVRIYPSGKMSFALSYRYHSRKELINKAYIY